MLVILFCCILLIILNREKIRNYLLLHGIDILKIDTFEIEYKCKEMLMTRKLKKVGKDTFEPMVVHDATCNVDNQTVKKYFDFPKISYDKFANGIMNNEKELLRIVNKQWLLQENDINKITQKRQHKISPNFY